MVRKNPFRAAILPVPEGTTRPLWSVMIPTYNCANYLHETLSSVLAQDPGPKFMQIEIVDDHSTKDDPEAVIKDLAGDRVHFYRQPINLGKVKNFETCLQRSRGKLIHLLHGDDCVRVGFYEKMQKLFEMNPEIGAGFCRHIFMDKDGQLGHVSFLEQNESGILTDWLEKIASGQRLATPSVVVRREVYAQLGGFDRRIDNCEDWEMWVRISAHFPVGYEPEPLALYRYKPLEILTLSHIKNLMNDMRLATEIIESYLSQHIPSNVSYRLAKKARESYAFWTLGVARQRLSEGNTATGITLLHESLKCDPSLKNWNKVLGIFIKEKLNHIKRAFF